MGIEIAHRLPRVYDWSKEETICNVEDNNQYPYGTGSQFARRYK